MRAGRTLIALMANLAGCIAGLHIASVQAQSPAPFPERAVRIVVPQPAGSTADRFARRVAERLATLWKQDVTIDNRPGTARLLPAELAARATNDGHVVMLVTAEIFELRPEATGGSVSSIARALQPISLLARTPLVLTADRGVTLVPDRDPNPNLDALDTLRRAALARPRALVLRTGPNGSLERLVATQFARLIAVSIDPRPRRELPGFVDGTVDLELAPLPAMLAAIHAGTSRPLLTTGAKRAPILRQLPTATEQGLAAIEFEQWLGIAAGAGLPTNRLTRLHTDFALTLATQALHDALIDEGFTPVASSPAEFATILQREEMRLHALVRGLSSR